MTASDADHGGSLLIFGGNAAAGGSVEIYDPAPVLAGPQVLGAAQAVAVSNPILGARDSHSATTLADGSILIAGGDDAASVFYRAAEIYTPDAAAVGPVDEQPPVEDQPIEEEPIDDDTDLPGERVVELGPGFNLVGWTGDTPIEEALATVDGSFSGVFVWDPIAEVFRSFNPSAPAFINDLEELLLGDGLWINIDDPGGATWTQPAFAEARSVDLVPGLQIAVWTGPDGTPIEEALAGLPAAVIQILTWDAVNQRFLSFNPQLPASLNTLQTLNHGDAFWIEVAQGVTWDQFPPGLG